jgi:predicted amidophosphoribosyltransferase
MSGAVRASRLGAVSTRPSRLLASLVDLVLPVLCVGCGAAGHPFCPGCAAACARPLVLPGPLPVVAHGWYADPLRTALVRYKERGRRDLAPPLGGLLGQALVRVLVRAPPGGVALVPVPSVRGVARQRGGDHVLRLAVLAGREQGLPVCPGLSLRRRVQDSARLGAAQRQANLGGAMVARPVWGQGRPPVAVVVDDIVTTGTTMREAVRALTEAGWRVAGAAVLAATPPPRARDVVSGCLATSQRAGLP